MPQFILLNDETLLEGAKALAAAEPRFATALEEIGPLPLRRQSPGFERLLSAIVGQQVSVAAARAIWARIEGAGLHRAEGIRTASDEDLRAVGLSAPKRKYARALAESGLDLEAIATLPDEDVIAGLVHLPGIGRWTAEIYAMFALGRIDIFPAADLALQEAARDLFSLQARPKEKELRALAAPWSPWRSVASTLLWEWYRLQKGRAGI